MALVELFKQAEQGEYDRAAILDRIEQTRHLPEPIIMTVEDYRNINRLLRQGNEGGGKMIYGRDMEDLIREGFLFTPDMARITTPGPIAVEAARFLHQDVLIGLGFIPHGEGRYAGIEGCTGSGSQTWALAQEGLWVDRTVEQDVIVQTLTGRNLTRLGLRKLGTMITNADIVKVLQSEIFANNGHGPQHDWVMLDPDWHGKPLKSKEPFPFSSMSPNGEELISLALQVAPVVGIKAPATLEDDEIRKVAEANDVVAAVRNIYLHLSPTELHCERMVFFIKKDDTSSLIGPNGDRIISNSTVLLNEDNQME